MTTTLQILWLILICVSPIYIYDYYKQTKYRRSMLSERHTAYQICQDQSTHYVQWKLRRDRQKEFGVKEKTWCVRVDPDRVEDFVAFCLAHSQYIDDFAWKKIYYDEIWGRSRHNHFVEGYFADPDLAVYWVLINDDIGGFMKEIDWHA